MFRRRRDEETVDVIRQELHAADVRARVVLAEAMAQIESRLTSEHAKTAHVQESTQAAIENLRYDVVTRPRDIEHVLEQVSAMCALMVERIEIDRTERRQLSETIALLAGANAGIVEGASSERSRVIGGTVLAASEPALDADTIDLEAIERDAIDATAVDATAVDATAVDATAVDLAAVEASAVDVALPLAESFDLDADAPQTIAVEAKASASVEQSVDRVIWNSFDNPGGDVADANDTLDLRPRRGTRLTAGRSNRDASWR